MATESAPRSTWPGILILALIGVLFAFASRNIIQQGRPSTGDNPSLVRSQFAFPYIQKLWKSSPVNDARNSELRELYLSTLKKSMCGVLLQTPAAVQTTNSLGESNFDAHQREYGLDWPKYGLTMVGMARMNNLHELVRRAIEENLEGDIVECGVWRGGAAILARAVLAAYGKTKSVVHAFDSFEGLPINTTAEDTSAWAEFAFLRVSQAEVERNFQLHGLLDSQVEFHKGYFRYSLPAWVASMRARGTIPEISVLRLDGDMYESTMDILYNLWNYVTPGGFVIVDDYSIPVCQKALHEFFARHQIAASLTAIDQTAVYFQKSIPHTIDISWYTNFNASRTAEG